MRKSKKKALVEKIKKNDVDAPNTVQTYLFSNALIKGILTIIIFILSLLLVEDVNKLSFISPEIFFTSTLIFLLLIVLFLVFLTYQKYFSRSASTGSYIIKVFDAYDLLSFIYMTINILFFVVLFILTPTVVSGDSMKNSFYSQDRLLVWHLGYTPAIDDAVIIDVSPENYPKIRDDERYFIKRVVATAGDTVEFNEISNGYGEVLVNGKIIENVTYEQFTIMTTFEKTNTSILDENNQITSEYSIVLGDNRSISLDSRTIGAVLNDDIQGKVVFVFYSKHGNFGFPKIDKA